MLGLLVGFRLWRRGFTADHFPCKMRQNDRRGDPCCESLSLNPRIPINGRPTLVLINQVHLSILLNVKTRRSSYVVKKLYPSFWVGRQRRHSIQSLVHCHFARLLSCPFNIQCFGVFLNPSEVRSLPCARLC
jgi:hypothetical protein